MIFFGVENFGVNVIVVWILVVVDVDIVFVYDVRFDLVVLIVVMESGEIDGFFWVGGLFILGIFVLVGMILV